MTRRKKADTPSTTVAEATQDSTLYIAMVIRNAREDFHVTHLTDEQMRVLNPIIRNSVRTALHAVRNYDRSLAAKEFFDYSTGMIPRYWERPVLRDDYLRCEARQAGEIPG